MSAVSKAASRPNSPVLVWLPPCIEARESNYRNCLRVKAGTNLADLRFVRNDATNISNYGPFDAVFICGLLYHLDRPRQFLADAARICRRVLFLETHVTHAERTPSVDIYKLSEVTENEGCGTVVSGVTATSRQRSSTG